MFVASPNVPLEGTMCFSMALFFVIFFVYGRTFQERNPRDMWSNMIWNILRETTDSTKSRDCPERPLLNFW